MASSTWEFPAFTKTIHRSSYPAIDPKNPANSAEGKVVVVTGGGAGIGKSIAEAYVQAGAKAVVILGRRENILDDAKVELRRARSSKILSYQADIIDEAALNSAFDDVEKEVGKVDVVVSNAGYLPDLAPALTADIADWWKGFEVNIKGTLLTFRAFMPHKSSNSPTFISLNTAAAHLQSVPNFSGYAVSKAAGIPLIQYLQSENPDVRVVSMHPGAIQTEMNTKSQMPLSTENINLPSSYAVWLASPAAAWLGGRFVWCQWDVDELAKMKDDIEANDELTLRLSGWPKQVGDPNIVL